MYTILDKKHLKKEGFYDPKTSLTHEELLEQLEFSKKKLLDALDTFDSEKQTHSKLGVAKGDNLHKGHKKRMGSELTTILEQYFNAGQIDVVTQELIAKKHKIAKRKVQVTIKTKFYNF